MLGSKIQLRQSVWGSGRPGRSAGQVSQLRMQLACTQKRHVLRRHATCVSRDSFQTWPPADPQFGSPDRVPAALAACGEAPACRLDCESETAGGRISSSNDRCSPDVEGHAGSPTSSSWPSVPHRTRQCSSAVSTRQTWCTECDVHVPDGEAHPGAMQTSPLTAAGSNVCRNVSRSVSHAKQMVCTWLSPEPTSVVSADRRNHGTCRLICISRQRRAPSSKRPGGVRNSNGGKVMNMALA